MTASGETASTPEIIWNENIKLILADVDQTVADDFMPAVPEMVREVNGLLAEGHSIFFVTGSPLNRLQKRLIDDIDPENRHRILVSHCSGAEVWGFESNGELRSKPYYSRYDDVLNPEQKNQWRTVMSQLIEEFELDLHAPMPVEEFRGLTKGNPLSVIYEDRGPQITLEIINGYAMSDEQKAKVKEVLPEVEEVVDLREPMQRRAMTLIEERGLPIEPRMAGVFALDFALQGVSKEQSIKHVLSQPEILKDIQISTDDLDNSDHLEVWGDRFDVNRGTDWLMCKALHPGVRAIDFRQEDPLTFPEGYNIVVWPGERQLQDGALDYIRSRHRN